MSLDEYRAFSRVVEEGTFTAAAEVLGASKSFVSKQVSRLEDRLGVQLLNRTTRQVTVTEAGEQFYERVTSILVEVEDAEAQAAAVQYTPRGTLRVSIPMSFGLRYLSPLVAEFALDNPMVAFDIDLNDRKVDVVAEGFDVAVRIGQLADSSLIARKLAPFRLYTVASPEYLSQHGRPEHPSDLGDHDCLLYRNVSASMTHTWTFESDDGRKESVRVTGRMLSNAGEASRDAAVAGLGVTRLPDFLCRDEIASGALVPLLGDWSYHSGAIWALFPHNRHVSATVRAFVDFLGTRLEAALPPAP